MLLIVAAFWGTASCSPDAEPSVEIDLAPVPVASSNPVLRAAMLEEEDARGTGLSGIEALREGLIAPDAELQRLAVRGIGRLEDPRRRHRSSTGLWISVSPVRRNRRRR